MRVPAMASAVLLALSGSAYADGYLSARSTPIEPAPSGWQFKYTPYGWLPWINGDVTVRGRDFSVEQNPGQVLSSLDFAYMSYQEARRGAVTLFSDVMYTKNGNSGSFARQDTRAAHQL